MTRNEFIARYVISRSCNPETTLKSDLEIAAEAADDLEAEGLAPWKVTDEDKTPE